MRTEISESQRTCANLKVMREIFMTREKSQTSATKTMKREVKMNISKMTVNLLLEIHKISKEAYIDREDVPGNPLPTTCKDHIPLNNFKFNMLRRQTTWNVFPKQITITLSTIKLINEIRWPSPSLDERKDFHIHRSASVMSWIIFIPILCTSINSGPSDLDWSSISGVVFCPFPFKGLGYPTV